MGLKRKTADLKKRMREAIRGWISGYQKAKSHWQKNCQGAYSFNT